MYSELEGSLVGVRTRMKTGGRAGNGAGYDTESARNVQNGGRRTKGKVAWTDMNRAPADHSPEVDCRPTSKHSQSQK